MNGAPALEVADGVSASALSVVDGSIRSAEVLADQLSPAPLISGEVAVLSVRSFERREVLPSPSSGKIAILVKSNATLASVPVRQKFCFVFLRSARSW